MSNTGLTDDEFFGATATSVPDKGMTDDEFFGTTPTKPKPMPKTKSKLPEFDPNIKVKDQRPKPIQPPKSSPVSQSLPISIAENQGSIPAAGENPEKIDITDEQAQHNNQLQYYLNNDLSNSKRTDSQEADYLATTFYPTDDKEKRLQHRRELMGAIKSYRGGYRGPVSFYQNEADTPEAITVVGDKSALNQPVTAEQDTLGDFGRGMAGALDTTGVGALKLTAKLTDALGVTDGKEEDIKNWEIDRNNRLERDYVNDDGYARTAGSVAGTFAQFAPLTELTPLAKIIGPGEKMVAGAGDMALQSGILSEVNSGGDVSLEDLLGEMAVGGLAGGLLHAKAAKGKAPAREPTPEVDTHTLEYYGIKSEDLPEGVTPSDAVDAINGSKELRNQAEAFKSKIKEPTAEDAFVNPDKDMANLEAKLKSEAENFSGKPLETQAVLEPHLSGGSEPAPVGVEAGISKRAANAQYAEATAPVKKLSPKEMEAKLKAEADAFIKKDLVTEKPSEAHVKTEATKAPEQVRDAPSEAPKADEPASAGSEPDEVTTRLMDALERANKSRPEQDALYTKERARRAAQVDALAASGMTGKELSEARLKIFSGELPKTEFEDIGSQFSVADIKSLHTKINDSGLNQYEKATAVRGMEKAMRGERPAPSEIIMMSRVFGKDFVVALSKHRQFLKESASAFGEIWNLPKSLMSTGDLSAPLRQGIGLVHSKEYREAFVAMHEYALSQKAFNKLEDDIMSSPYYALAEEGGLSLTVAGDVLGPREDAFHSHLGEQIPVVGIVVRGSERAHVGFLNQLRFNTFKTLVKKAEALGIDVRTNPKNLKAITNYINIMTGRGGLGKLEDAADLLNGVFFSPRLISSRLQILTGPVLALFGKGYIADLPKGLRVEAAKSYTGMVGFYTTAVGLAVAAGYTVETDPRSSDFGKIRDGNTRVDLGGGLLQYITYGARVITGETKSTTTGAITKFDKKTNKDLGLDLKLISSKLHPALSLIVDYRRDMDNNYKPFTWSNAIISRITPMGIPDIVSTLKEHPNSAGLVYSVLGIYGASLTNYDKKDKGLSDSEFLKTSKTVTPEPVATKTESHDAGGISDTDFLSQSGHLKVSAANTNAVRLAESLGFHVNDSGIRSLSKQKYLYDNFEGAAKPGTSPHGEGRAIDLSPKAGTTPDKLRRQFEAKGYKGVTILTKPHGTDKNKATHHWHIQWQSYKEG